MLKSHMRGSFQFQNVGNYDLVTTAKLRERLEFKDPIFYSTHLPARGMQRGV